MAEEARSEHRQKIGGQGDAESDGHLRSERIAFAILRGNFRVLSQPACGAPGHAELVEIDLAKVVFVDCAGGVNGDQRYSGDQQRPVPAWVIEGDDEGEQVQREWNNPEQWDDGDVG